MIYGSDKYECFQDITPYEYMLVRLILSATHDGREDTAMGRFAADALRLLNVDILFKQSNFEEIRNRMQEMLAFFPPEGTPPYIPKDEPVFLLRSTDPAAPKVIETWIETATKLGVSGCRIKSASEQLLRVKAYSSKLNPGKQEE